MKIKYLLIGILIGIGLGFAAVKFSHHTSKPDAVAESKSTNKKWKWPESLDALKAAQDNHKVVYEDDNVRILAVMLDGKKSEPIHTHKWKSVMWIAKPIVPCQINNYKMNENGKLVKSDSLLIKNMPINMGQLIDPEEPTSITNLSSENGVAYRVEFKKEFVR